MSGYIASNGSLTAEYTRCIRQEATAHLSFCHCICMERMTKPTNASGRISGVLAEVLTGHLPKTDQKLYFFSYLAW